MGRALVGINQKYFYPTKTRGINGLRPGIDGLFLTSARVMRMLKGVKYIQTSFDQRRLIFFRS
jgi:hypothetical protein